MFGNDFPLPVYHDHRRVDGVALHVAPHYLPAYGTLLVDGSVESNRPGYDPAPVRCAIHYLKYDDGFRYRVLPVGEDGRAHALPYTPDRPLTQQIGPEWAASETVTLDGAEVPALTIRLTDGPIPDPPETQAQINETEINLADEPDIEDGHTVDAVSTRVVTPSVPRLDPARLPVPGLADVLTQEGTLAGTRERWLAHRGLQRCPYRYRGPRFTLSGTVYFRPLQPFDPAPTLDNAANQRLASREEIEFVYPRDVLHTDVRVPRR